jgi:hypothetical protein
MPDFDKIDRLIEDTNLFIFWTDIELSIIKFYSN